MAAKRLCSVEGCGKPFNAKGYCGAHYRRLRLYGDPLAGKTPHGAPMAFIRQVIESDPEECTPWPFNRNAGGYALVSYDGKLSTAGRAICTEIHGPAPTPDHEAAHSCGKGHEGCITPRHLSWKTRKENQGDRVGHGTHIFGEAVSGAKLTDDKVREIIRLKGHFTQAEIADRFGVCFQTVSLIHLGKIWKHVE